jgi:DNA polymerase bacteriophage-type
MKKQAADELNAKMSRPPNDVRFGSQLAPQPRSLDAQYGKHILYRDWETYSEVDIQQSGALYYAVHSTTLPLLICYAVDDGPVQSYRPGSGEPIPEVFFTAAHDPNWRVVSHNDLFDNAIEIYQAAPRFNWPLVPIERQICTMALAQYHGYPGALEKIANRLALPLRKDKDGKKLMRRLTKPQRRPDGTWGYIEPTPEEWERFIKYCKTDTSLVRPVLRYFKPLPEVERRLYQLDHKINHRGFTIDVALATPTCELIKAEKANINARLCEITGGAVTAFTKLKDICAFVNARGHNMVEVDKRTVATMLARNPDSVVREVLELRQAGANSAAAKYDAVLKCVGPDQRIRGLLRIYGTITRRWTSTRFNIHNLPREDSKTAQAEIEAIRSGDLEQVRKFGPPLDVIARAVRGLVIAPAGKLLLIGDFNMIEPRLISWYSEEGWRLENFRKFDQTGDPLLDDYRVLGARMRGGPVDPKDADARRRGKVAILSFGYGGSVRTWRKHVPDDPRSDEEIKAQEVNRFRQIYPAHTAFMFALEQQALACVASREPVIGKRHRFTMDGDTLLLHLASGRALSYSNARIKIGEYGKNVVVYHDAGNDAEEMWYGAWCAHLISGTARDLLANALLNLDAAGFEIVLHVHDEVVAEADADKVDLDLFKRCMLDAPDWADGLPLATKVRASGRYIKIEEPTSEPVDGTAFHAEQPSLVDPIDGDRKMFARGEIALALAAKGFRIFPLIPGAKTPAIKRWPQRATADAKQIRDWWTQRDFNIGIATGRADDATEGLWLVVVDYDCKDGKHGGATLEAHEAAGYTNTFSTKTPGGRHCYYWSEKRIPNSVSRVAQHVDIRCHHGYVVAIGSVVAGREYVPLNSCAMVATLPDELAAAATKPGDDAKANGHSKEPACELDTEAAIEHAIDYLVNTAPEAVEGSGGDDATYRTAAWIKDYGLTSQTAFELMRDYWNEQKATPPWELEGPKSLRQKVENAYDYGQNQPGKHHPSNNGKGSDEPSKKQLFQSSAEFVAGFTPPDYLIDGLLQRRYVYSFTAKTGDGKTTIALLLAVCVARGTPLAGREVEKGRVLFFAGENPDDVRTRWIKLCEALGEDPDRMDVVFMPFTLNLSEEAIRAQIDAEAAKAGPFSLLIVDTSASYYSGDDENDNVKLGQHAKMLRSFVNLPGGPTILVTCHPIKNPDMMNLLPRGGGAFLAEVDGNLVAIKDANTMLVEVTWHGKFRGPDFAPFSFKLIPAQSPKLVDSKGRLVWSIYAQAVSDAEQEILKNVGHAEQGKVLRVMLSHPGCSLAEIAEHLHWRTREGKPSKQKVHRIMAKLQKAKLVRQRHDERYVLTKGGQEAAAETPERTDDLDAD